VTGMWQLFTASVRGATHLALSLPNQDAVGFRGDPASPQGVVAVAVADGHGDPHHFRSGRGAQFAVEVACDLSVGFAAGLAEAAGRERSGAAATPALQERLRMELAPAVVEGWRTAVAEDLRRHPLNQRELATTGGDPLMAYGSTLLFAILHGQRALLAQIGDGDLLAIEAGGRALTPLPPDPLLRGRFTTSLCQEDPLASFRVGALDLEEPRLAFLLLATDGFGNSQVDDPWYQPFATDLVRLAAGHGLAWVGEHLPDWAARCASTEGSGDDTTLALLAAAGAPS